MNFLTQAMPAAMQLLASTATALLALTPVNSVLAQTNSAAPADKGAVLEALETVIVTARRTEESTQTVPISITTFTGQRLQEQSIVSTQSLQASVPSLVVGPNGQGSRETESPTIRGQGATFQASPGVAMYMAEVPLPTPITLSQQGGPGNFLDLQNLQVLKGPQGTLFGRNTTGGAILLEPKRPTNSFAGYAQVQGGNYGDQEAQLVVNLPVIDNTLLVRLAAEHVDRDGFTHDLTFNKDRDDKHYTTGRLGITWRPTDTFENYFMSYVTESHNNGAGLVNRGFNTAAMAQANFFGLPFGECVTPTCSEYTALTNAQNARGPRTIALSVDEKQETDTWSVNDIANWDVTPNLTLRNIASYAVFTSHYRYDGDGSIASQNDVNPFGDTPRDDIKQYSEELQLQGKALGQRLKYIVGAFYYKNEPNGTQGATAVNFCPLPFGAACSTVPDFNQITRIGISNTSKAAYVQGTYDFGGLANALDGLRLTAGYRYTWDTVDGYALAYNASSANGPNAVQCSAAFVITTNIADCSFTANLKKSAPTWTIGLDYSVTNDLLVYAKASRGYKSGGFNTYAVYTETRTFGPEFVDAYEAGFKSDFRVASAPARFNLNYFYLNYDSIQRAAGDFNPVSFGNGAQILSSASARIQGVEVEAQIKPISGLELGFNYSYTDASYKKYPFTPHSPAGTIDCTGAFIPMNGTADMSCLPMQYLSPNIGSVSVRYALPLDTAIGEVSAFVSYSYTDKQYTDALIRPQDQPGARLESFGLVNASLDWRNIFASAVDVGLFVTNATDKLYRTSNTDVYQAGSLLSWATIYGEPRMYGVRLRYHWGK